MGNIRFENIKDSDVLTFELWEQGFGPRCIYYLYDEKGDLKDVQCGKAIPLSERKMTRPVKKKKSAIIEQKKEKQKKISIIKKNAQHSDKKRNISLEEKQRRSEKMRLVVKQYWQQKRKINGSS